MLFVRRAVRSARLLPCGEERVLPRAGIHRILQNFILFDFYSESSETD